MILGESELIPGTFDYELWSYNLYMINWDESLEDYHKGYLSEIEHILVGHIISFIKLQTMFRRRYIT